MKQRNMIVAIAFIICCALSFGLDDLGAIKGMRGLEDLEKNLGTLGDLRSLTKMLYKKVQHNTDPEAKCLDGSSPIVYLHEGGDTKHILFYFIGGGSCADNDLNSTLQTCYQRSKGQFGSSKVWPDILPSIGFGLLEADESKSKFFNWTKIVILYCDGAFHQGNNKSPVKYKDTELYFRGAVNTRSHFKWADSRYGLANAEQIVLSGSSAGGIATFLWIDYIRSLVPNPKVVTGIADSGIFLEPSIEVNSPQRPSPLKKRHLKLVSQKKIVENPIISPEHLLLTRFSNIDEKTTPNTECTKRISPKDYWKCLFIQFAYPTLKSPILFIESSYDANIIPIFLQIECLERGVSSWTPKNCPYRLFDIITMYRNNYIDKIVPRLLKMGHSLWSSSCSWHAEIINSTIYDSDLQRIPQKTGLKMREAVEQYIFEGKRIINIDYLPWPSNEPCAF